MAENSSSVLYIAKSSQDIDDREYLKQCKRGLSFATRLNHFILRFFRRGDKSIDVFYIDGLLILHKRIETMLEWSEMFLTRDKVYYTIGICISHQLRVDIHKYAEQVYERYYPSDPRIVQTNFAVAFYATQHIMREMTDFKNVHWEDGQGDDIEKVQTFNVSHLMLYLSRGYGY